MILGFTGTRQGMSRAQLCALPMLIAALPGMVVHGGAEGADEQFDDWLISVGMDPRRITVMPGHRERARYWAKRGRLVAPIRPPLDRNRDIVETCDHLLAASFFVKEALRSGTWMTVRHARRVGRPIMILLPDGDVRAEGCDGGMECGATAQSSVVG